MSIPVIEATAVDSRDQGDTTVPYNIPSGITSGDLLIIYASNVNSSESTGWLDDLTDWTLEYERDDDDANGQCSYGIYWKESDGTEIDGTITSVHSVNSSTITLRISGADTTTPFHKYLAGTDTTNITTHVVGEVTTTNDNCLILAGGSWPSGESLPITESGTGWSINVNSSSGPDSWDAANTLAEKDLATAGASGDCTFEASFADQAHKFQLAINEAASGVPPSVFINSNQVIG